MKRSRGILEEALIDGLMAALAVGLALASPGAAMLVPSRPESRSEAGAPTDQDKALKDAQRELESELLRQRLLDFKLTPSQIQARLDRLSDEQVHQASLQVGVMNPGGAMAPIFAVAAIALVISAFARIMSDVWPIKSS
jgi:hypothetical protein